MPFIFWSLQRDFLNLLWCSSSLDNLIIHCVWLGIFRFLIFTQITIKFRTSVYSPAYLCLLSWLLVSAYQQSHGMSLCFCIFTCSAYPLLIPKFRFSSNSFCSLYCWQGRQFCGDILSDVLNTAQDREVITVLNLTRWQLMENMVFWMCFKHKFKIWT